MILGMIYGFLAVGLNIILKKLGFDPYFSNVSANFQDDICVRYYSYLRDLLHDNHISLDSLIFQKYIYYLEFELNYINIY